MCHLPLRPQTSSLEDKSASDDGGRALSAGKLIAILKTSKATHSNKIDYFVKCHDDENWVQGYFTCIVRGPYTKVAAAHYNQLDSEYFRSVKTDLEVDDKVLEEKNSHRKMISTPKPSTGCS